MIRIHDEMLIAFADGELEPSEHALVEAALADDPSLRERLDRQQRLRQRIAAHYAPVAEELVPDRIASLLSAAAEAGGHVVSIANERERRAKPICQNLTALAATLVVGLFAGMTIPRSGDAPFALEQGSIVARGSLEEALETRLASDRGGETRIGITFAAIDRRICRTFDTAAVSGLACRGDDDWRIESTAAASTARGEFHQASSGSALVLAAAQELIAGEPFDAEAERRARDNGWRNQLTRD